MKIEEAINNLGDGHTFWKVSYAKKILKTLGLGELPKYLIEHYESQAKANPDNHYKGLFLKEDKPTSGVSALPLSDYVVQKLGLEVRGYLGRGFQARANAEAIAKKYKVK